MTKYDLLDVIGTLDEKYLKEAEERANKNHFIEDEAEEEIIMTTSQSKTKTMPKYFGAAIAASLVLIGGTGVYLFNKGNGGFTYQTGNDPGSSLVMTQVTMTETDPEATQSTTTITTTTTTPKPVDLNQNVTNIFGSKGSLTVCVSDGIDLALTDNDNNFYCPVKNQMFTKNSDSADNSHISQKLSDQPNLVYDNMFSDGREVYYYGTDRKIYRLSYDCSKWNVYADLSQTDFVGEHTGVTGAICCGDYRAFIFENQMNLNILAREYVCIYNHVTGKWTKLLDAKGDMLHAASYHYDEKNGQLVVCQESEDNTAKHDFLFYDLESESEKPVKAICNVDTFDDSNGAFDLGAGAFVGLAEEWCAADGNVYFKSVDKTQNANGRFQVYKVSEGMTAAEKICDNVGMHLILVGNYIYTDCNNSFVRYDLLKNMKVETLLKDSLNVNSISYASGKFLIERCPDGQNEVSDILYYDVDYEDSLIRSNLSSADYDSMSNNVIYSFRYDGAERVPMPILARKPAE